MMQSPARSGPNPVVNDRQPTDRLFIVLFLIILVTWLGVCIGSFYTRRRDDDKNEFDHSLEDFEAGVDESVPVNIILRALLSLILSTAGVYAYVYVLDMKARSFIYTGKLMTFFVGFRSFVVILVGLYDIPFIFRVPWFEATIRLARFIIKTIGSITIIVSCIAYYKADKIILVDIIEDACRPILGTFLTILFEILMKLLEFLVYAISLVAFVLNILSDRSSLIMHSTTVVVLLGGVYISGVFGVFSTGVIGEYSARHYWENDQTTPYLFSLCVIDIFKYHFGSIAFASTYAISLVFRSIQSCRHKRSTNTTDHWLFYGICKIYVTLHGSLTDVIFSAIYGTDLFKSMRTKFDVILRRSLLCLAMNAVYVNVCMVIPFFLWTIGFVLSIAIAPLNYPQEEARTYSIIIIASTAIPLVAYFSLALKTIWTSVIIHIITTTAAD